MSMEHNTIENQQERNGRLKEKRVEKERWRWQDKNTTTAVLSKDKAIFTGLDGNTLIIKEGES